MRSVMSIDQKGKVQDMMGQCHLRESGFGDGVDEKAEPSGAAGADNLQIISTSMPNSHLGMA